MILLGIYATAIVSGVCAVMVLIIVSIFVWHITAAAFGIPVEVIPPAQESALSAAFAIWFVGLCLSTRLGMHFIEIRKNQSAGGAE